MLLLEVLGLALVEPVLQHSMKEVLRLEAFVVVLLVAEASSVDLALLVVLLVDPKVIKSLVNMIALVTNNFSHLK